MFKRKTLRFIICTYEFIRIHKYYIQQSISNSQFSNSHMYV